MLKVTIPSLDKETNLPASTGGLRVTVQKAKDLEGKYESPFGMIDPFDSINFRDIYKDDISKYREYNVPTTRNFNWDEQRARNQGTGEKWLNGVSKALVTTAGAVVENTLGVLAGLGEMAFGSGYYYDNFIGKSVDKANDWMREAMPNYRTQAEIDMPTGQKLGTANFWADTVLNGAGYSLGSIATMWLTGGTGLIARGANVLGKSQRLKKIYDTSKAITTGTQLADKAFKANRAKGLLTAANTVEMGLYMSLAESSVEAREAQKTAYEGLVEKELERLGLENEAELGEEKLNQILQASYAAGNADFLIQLPVLAGTNLLMFGKQVAGFKTASKINKDVAFDNITKEVINKVGARGTFRNAMSRLKPFAQGSLTEAFQEGWQFASKVGAIDYHTDKYFNGGFADMSESILQGLNETVGTQEGLESMLVGAIVGGGVSGVTSIVQKPYAQRQKNAQYLTDLLNGGYLRNAANKGMTSNAMTLALVQMEQARQNNDIKAFKDAQNKLIMYNAFEAMQSGGFDVFMEKLEDTATLSDEEFAKTFGYDTKKSIQDQTGKTKRQIIDNTKKKYESFKETYDSITEYFPPADRKTGLPRMRMSEEERKAEEKVYAGREALRAQLILGMAAIKNRNSRLKSIHDNMQSLLDTTVNLNNGSILKDILALPQFAGKVDEYSATEENKRTQDRLKEVLQTLVKNKVDPNKITEFRKQAADYLALLAENQVAVEAHIKLNSDTFAQEQFKEEVANNVAAAKQRAKDEKDKKNVEEAKTTDDIKNNTKDAEGETKVDAEIKNQDLKRQEQEKRNEYLFEYQDLPIPARIKKLKAIDTSKLTDIERKGLVDAISRLEKLNRNQEEKIEVTEEQPVQDFSELIEEEEDVTEKEFHTTREPIITDTTQLEIFNDTSVENEDNETPVLGVELAEDPTIWVSERKVGVNDDGVPDGSEADTIEGKEILINQDLLLGEVQGTEVEFVIVENDFFVENHKGKPTEDEYTPIYVKIGTEYVGKLKRSKGKDRKAILDKLRAGEKVTTKIAQIVANNYNNAVLSEASSTSYFYNVEDVIGNGKNENVLLAFTTGNPGETDIVQWEVAPVSDQKNQADLPKIQRETQREQSEGRMDQVAVVVRPENVPGGKSRIYVLSTANLSESAVVKVLDLIKERNYDGAKEIVAASVQRRGENNPSYLEFSTFENGDKYLVYYSPKLRKLVRINENEMNKALNNQKASFNLVSINNNQYKNDGKRNTEDLKFNLAEDFGLFLGSKKYHVDKALANSVEPYTSPVNPENTYNNYQEYLFSENEVGDRVEGTGHYSILSIDAVKLGESLFNNPKVTFEKGNIVGETKQEVVEKTNFTEIKKAIDASSANAAPQGFKDKFNKKNCK